MPDGYFCTKSKSAPSVGLTNEGDQFIPKLTTIINLLDKALKIAFQPPKIPVSGYRAADASMAGARVGVRYPCDKEVVHIAKRDAFDYLRWLNQGNTGTYDQFRKGTEIIMLAPQSGGPLDRLRVENIKFRKQFERIRTIGYGASLKYGEDAARDQMATIAGEALLG